MKGIQMVAKPIDPDVEPIEPIEPNLDQRMAQIREANERLVVVAVRAQSLTEEAEKASHLKDEFLATVSHEIRTPLNAVLGWVRLLESKQLPTERVEQAIAAIGRNASALAHMVDDLLDTSRILKGAIRLALQPVDLDAVTQAALDAVRPPCGDQERVSRVRCRSRLSNDQRRRCSAAAGDLESAVECDQVHACRRTCGCLHRVFERLHGDQSGRYRARASAPALLPHVFDRFRQADDATTQRHTGLGLGLGIVRQLVELHGGTVHADSPGVGHGATFAIRLPIAAGGARLVFSTF
jgi:signal transduction histidine kinase